jgi:hypothetical protein
LPAFLDKNDYQKTKTGMNLLRDIIFQTIDTFVFACMTPSQRELKLTKFVKTTSAKQGKLHFAYFIIFYGDWLPIVVVNCTSFMRTRLMSCNTDSSVVGIYQ